MKTRTKALLLTLCAVLLVTASVMGTMAYLTSTKTVTNTFTVGKVAITLDEKDITRTDGTRTDKGNTYHLLPGHEYDKDPTVTVKADSEDAYVRMKVTVTFGKELDNTTLATDLDSIFTGYSEENWPRYNKNTVVVTKIGENGGKYTEITYEYRYKETVKSKTEDQKLDALFDKVVVPDNWDNDMMEAVGGFTVNVVAEAIQAAGFATADAAWEKFPTTTNTTPAA